MTPFQKEIKRLAEEFGADKVVCKKDGSIHIQRDYYYRPIGWIEQVKAFLMSNGISGSISSEDHFARWPARSYLTAIVKPLPEGL